MGVIKQLQGSFRYVYDHVKSVNDSKFFAGLIVILLNVSSKFTTLPISKTMESYLKNTFSKHILVFAIAWVGTRDIFVAITVTVLFILVMNVLLNENSPFCCFTESFMNHHMSLIEDGSSVSKEELDIAIKTFEKAQAILIKQKGDQEPKPNKVPSGHMKFLNFMVANPDVFYE